MDWIYVPQNRDMWYVLVNVIMELQVEIWCLPGIAEDLLASQERLCCMEVLT